MRNNQIPDKQLKFRNSKFVITKRLYNELISQTNYMKSIIDCQEYIWKALRECSDEVIEVKEFAVKKIDFEI